MQFVGMSRCVVLSVGEHSAAEFDVEAAALSAVEDVFDGTVDEAAFRSRNRRLLGGNKSRSADCFAIVVELLVLLPSPPLLLEHELASSLAVVERVTLSPGKSVY
jgi:hypothetical protein